MKQTTTITVFTKSVKDLKNYINQKQCWDNLSTTEIQELTRPDTENICAAVWNLDQDEFSDDDMNNLSFDITIDRNGTVAYSTVNRAFESLAQLIQPFIIVEDGDEAEVILHVSVADIRKYNPKLEPDILRDIIKNCFKDNLTYAHQIIEDD